MTKSLLIIAFFSMAALAQNASSQIYSELAGTQWQGAFQVKVGRLKAMQPFPIEISFLSQATERGIGYLFKKDISQATKAETMGFNTFDAVSCYVDGVQEPRIISLQASQNGSYSGKIFLNNCKPSKGKEKKEAQEMELTQLAISDGGKRLTIHVLVKKVVRIEYHLRRVSEADFKIK